MRIEGARISLIFSLAKTKQIALIITWFFVRAWKSEKKLFIKLLSLAYLHKVPGNLVSGVKRVNSTLRIHYGDFLKTGGKNESYR